MDIPSFDWPIAYFPKYKYPLNDHVAENEAEDQKSLDDVRNSLLLFFFIRCGNCFIFQVKKVVAESNRQGATVAGLIVEPIQAEGGDNYALPKYFRKLRRFAEEVRCPVTFFFSRKITVFRA